MLDDRDYMRDYGSRRTWSLTTILLVATTAAFVLQILVQVAFPRFDFNGYLALSLDGLKQFRLWQLLSFQFLHGGVIHLIGNLLVIYFFGRELEATIGSRAMAYLYFLSGMLGGLVQMVGAFALPQVFGGAVMGASAGAFGLVAAFATFFPHRPLTLLIFFVIPLTMRARTLLWISIGFALFGIITPSDHIAHLAHLGGIMAGYGFVHFALHTQSIFSSFDWAHLKNTFRRKLPKRVATRGSLVASSVLSTKPGGSGLPLPEEEDPEFISKEVDPILDKISAHGIHSLTERERKILERARSKMARR